MLVDLLGMFDHSIKVDILHVWALKRSLNELFVIRLNGNCGDLYRLSRALNEHSNHIRGLQVSGNEMCRHTHVSQQTAMTLINATNMGLLGIAICKYVQSRVFSCHREREREEFNNMALVTGMFAFRID